MIKLKWEKIKGYDNLYFISENGDVKNSSGLIMKTHLDKDGYLKLSLSKNATTKNFYIHILVAKHYVENPENKPEVNHDDCIKINNNYKNLSWMTRLENQRHAIENGLLNPQKGEERYNSKLTDENVLFIRQNKKTITNIELSKKFNISQSIISDIKNNKRWIHVIQ